MKTLRTRYLYTLISLVILGGLYILLTGEDAPKSDSYKKINGVNLVAPPDTMQKSDLHSLRRINATWISIIPYAYIPRNASKVIYFQRHPHWWGEGIYGATEQIRMARELGYKIMVKPHVWVVGEGWAGEFTCRDEDSWKEWESSYTDYILSIAQMCEDQQVNLLCFSTEFSKAVRDRPQFWSGLIDQIREFYHGKVTYAANWDNFENVRFWDQLDYIGIDAYFPLDTSRTPQEKQLKETWSRHALAMKGLSKKLNKKVLLTEYGYRSADYTAHQPWQETGESVENQAAQAIAFKALYESLWNEPWLAGGFIWKWHPDDEKSPYDMHDRFTPQGKAAERVISEWYGKAYR